jgi:hypothetical protein
MKFQCDRTHILDIFSFIKNIKMMLYLKRKTSGCVARATKISDATTCTPHERTNAREVGAFFQWQYTFRLLLR